MLACNIGANNAIIDTDRFKVGLDVNLSGLGTLVKRGSGTLVLNGSNTFSSVTSVEAGTLMISPFGDANLKLHLDASDASSLFAISDGTGAITASGQPVGYWGDLTGNNKPAKQATLANRPTYTNNVADFNGRAVLQFDGVDDDITSLLDINPTNLPNMTIMIVYKQLDKSGNAGLWGHDNTGWDRLQLFYNSGTYYQIATANNAMTVKGMETNKVTLYTAVLKDGASSSRVYINGVSDANTGVPGFTSTDSGGYASITFANISPGGGYRGKVQIGEVLIFDAALGDTARRNVEARLRNKWFGTSDPTNTPVLKTSVAATTLSTETLASLKLRLDASVASSLFTNATGVGTITTAGQPVGYWGDLSSNNKPALQTNLVNRPTYMTNLGVFNNLPVLQFDGSASDITSLLDINATNLPNMTIMMAYRQVTTKLNGGLWGHDDGGWDRLQLLNFQSLSSNNIAGNNNSMSVKGMNTNVVLLYTAVLKNGVTNGSYVYINSVSDANTGLPAFTSSEGTGLSSLTFGAIAPGSYRGNIQIGEVLVFDTALSDAARTNAEAYLRDKWTVAFPGRVNVANGAILDLDGVSQTLTSVSGAGTISNGTLTVSEPLSPAGDTIGTLKVSNIALNGTLLVNVAWDGSCDQLLGTGSLSLSGLTLQIADTRLLNWLKSYTLVTCSGTLTGELTATLPKNWKIKYDRIAGTATLVYIPPGTVLRLM
jgi:autotransporter-associated beta strand protein